MNLTLFRNSCRAALLALPLAAAVTAGPITLASLGTAADPGQTNNAYGANTPTIVINQNPAWATPFSGSHWVSFADTGAYGPNFVVVPNGTTVDFTQIFNITGTPLSGSIRVMADDSTSIWLNGILLQSEATSTNNHYRTCSDIPPGCLISTAATVNLTPALRSGRNTLVFGVSQRAGDSFGLDYSGLVNSTEAPEPATYAMLGLGLVLIALSGRLRRRRAAAILVSRMKR